jgi:hypothetical protein
MLKIAALGIARNIDSDTPNGIQLKAERREPSGEKHRGKATSEVQS